MAKAEFLGKSQESSLQSKESLTKSEESRLESRESRMGSLGPMTSWESELAAVQHSLKFVMKLKEEFVCPICNGVVLNPQQNSCGHIYCFHCLQRLLESSSPSSPFCPVDGDVITPAEIFQDNCCKREISSLEVYCTNFPACTSVLTLNQLQEHLKLCQYEQLQCTNPGCEEVQQRRYLQKHLTNTCPHRREACPYCRQLFQLGIIQNQAGGMWKVKPPVAFPMEMRYQAILESLAPPDPLSQFHLKRGSPEEEFPDLCRNSTWMGRILTPAMYCRQFNRCTHSGVIFDDVIRPGIEEPGDCTGTVSVGCVAGDAECYILFCDFFDRVIEAYHEHKVSNQTPESDFNYDNLKGGDDFDTSYAIRCEVSVVRGIEDFCFPTHCSRGERRQLLLLARRVLQQLEKELPGCLFLLDGLNQEQQMGLKINPPSSSQLRIGVARDWPDARAVWVSKDSSLVVWVNMEDHLKLVSTRDDANVAEAFKCICITLQKLEEYYKELRHPFIWQQQLGWVTSSPADVGTGLRINVSIKLQLLPQHKRLPDILKRLRIRMDKTDSPTLYHVSSAATFGPNEVELTQLVVDAVKLLIAMEKRLERDIDIDELVPTQK